uniref:Phosphoinositide phosphatase family protein n=1 Tax=Rhizophora mucronata TaxID=61149 RepID=A0A2P2M2B2_RHIMU
MNGNLLHFKLASVNSPCLSDTTAKRKPIETNDKASQKEATLSRPCGGDGAVISRLTATM